MIVKFIAGKHRGEFHELHQSCNDWLTLDWIVGVFKITHIAFDKDGLAIMRQQDIEGKSGIRGEAFEIYELPLHADDTFRFSYRRRGSNRSWKQIRKF